MNEEPDGEGPSYLRTAVALFMLIVIGTFFMLGLEAVFTPLFDWMGLPG